ncbi:MAG TPA: glycosyltransferase [Stellaceae bacterium]|nr:glycosyltransferase [Stellaceae bacterium]
MTPRPAVPALKWYFAANLNAFRHFFEQIAVAVKSARANTPLRPCCLVDDRAGLDEMRDKLTWLEQSGVQLIFRRAALFEIVRAHFGEQADIFSGHWLRCDIPILEDEEDFVLYTDIDVMFRRYIDLSNERPPFIACTPEQEQNDLSYFNSGVMVMNIPALRAARDELIATLHARLPNMEPHDDQGMFNATFRGRWTRLPNTYNWKPYWGFNPDAAIVHFHGPKPGAVQQMLLGRSHLYPADYSRLFQRDPDGYARYIAEFERFLGADVSFARATGFAG